MYLSRNTTFVHYFPCSVLNITRTDLKLEVSFDDITYIHGKILLSGTNVWLCPLQLSFQRLGATYFAKWKLLAVCTKDDLPGSLVCFPDGTTHRVVVQVGCHIRLCVADSRSL